MNDEMFLMRAKHQSELDYIVNYILKYGDSGSIDLDGLDDFSQEDLMYIERELRKHDYYVNLTLSEEF